MLVLALLSAQALAAYTPILVGQVVGIGREPIAFADVTITCDRPQNPVQHVHTDQHGRFTVRENVADTCVIDVAGMQELDGNRLALRGGSQRYTLRVEGGSEDSTFSKDFLARIPAGPAYTWAWSGEFPSTLTPDVIEGRSLIHPRYLDLPVGGGAVDGLVAATYAVPALPPVLHQVSLDPLPVDRYDDAMALVPGMLRTPAGAWVSADGATPVSVYVNGVRRDR